MVFLINSTNLNEGGGLQVTQSICSQLINHKEHTFIVLLSSFIEDSYIKYAENTTVLRYDIKNSIKTLLWGRDRYLDNVVNKYGVDAVLTVFGPSRWIPRVPHLCGFARAQLIIKDSPYNNELPVKEKIRNYITTWLFRKSSKCFYTENEYISKKLPTLLGEDIKVNTVSNFYNQIYDEPEKWVRNHTLPTFKGITCLSVSTHYPHKNFEIIINIVRYLKVTHPNFGIRFVLTFNKEKMPVPDDVRDSIIFTGKVEVSECPYLYEQCDIMFMPTLVECFTATYPEAMKMGKPIVTTDLEFARGLCGEAACYYSPVDSGAAAEALYRVSTEKEYANTLVNNGKHQLLKYDNNERRAEKLIHILETLA